MKILLDEQLPVTLKFRLMPEFEVSTVKDEKNATNG
jgi:predicted nuclease of predicted toxin-antitoxin system